MMKRLLILFLVASTLISTCACAFTKNTVTVVPTELPPQRPTITILPTNEPTVTPTLVPTKAPVAPNTVYPLPVTTDITHLDNCSVAVSFEKDGFYKAKDGTTRLKATVYTYDLYDLVDISLLKEGDTIVLRGEKVEITSLTHTDFGSIQINGGLDVGGYELRTDNHTVYYEIGYSDVKSYYALGEVTLPVADYFTFTDGFDLDKGDILYSSDDFFTEHTAFYFHFTPHDTTIVIENGQVTAMNRIYTP